MEYILNWKPEYLVGDAMIDGQHQQLFELANGILKSNDRLETSKMLFQLFRYTREHFAAEEALMKRRGYLGYEVHREEHNKLIEMLSGVIAHSTTDNDVFHKEVYTLMYDWVLGHIIDYDMRIPKA